MGLFDFFRRLLGGEEPSDEKPAKVRAQTTGPTPLSAPAKRTTRLIHLGVDFGTCWSKVVMRDYQAPTERAFVVRLDEDYRIPSAVVECDGRLHFGCDGAASAARQTARVIRSPKMLLAGLYEGEPPALPSGLGAADLCALAIAYVLQVGEEKARAYCRAVAGGAEPRITMTIGAPMSSLDDEDTRDKFVAVARLAFEIWRHGGVRLLHGITVARAAEVLATARERLAARTVSDPREWVRSEAEAGLLWAFKSPNVGAGLYACVDVGAGTTDVSVFRIIDEHADGRVVKSGMVFYSATSGIPGVDRIDRVLAEASGDGLNPESLRGREAEELKQAGLAAKAAAADAARAMYSVYKTGWQLGYAKEPRQSVWDGYKLFVLGGGSQIPVVSETLTKTPWAHLSDRKVSNPGFPDDLFELPTSNELRPFAENPTFLLVAYGLSWLGADVPPVDNPADVPRWEPPTNRRGGLDQDELYPK